MADRSSPEARFARLAEALRDAGGVTLGSGRRGFGSDALQVDGKIFAMLRRGRLVLKLPAVRSSALVAGGDAAPFDAGKGRPMKEWVVLAEGTERRWLALAREALAFVGGRPR